MWKQYTLICMTIALAVIIRMRPSYAQQNCLDTQPTQFAVGMRGTGAGSSVNLYEQASKQGKVQGSLQRDEAFTVTGGPT